MESEDKLHASGHASGKEIKGTLDQIKAKTIIPIHTEQPNHLKQFYDNTTQPEYEKTIDL